MEQGHEHHHSKSLKHLSKAFIIGIVLNSAFVLIEFISGFYTNSLALLSDAGHNLSDVGTLALSLFAFQVSKRKATARYTFGFHKGTILASLANAVILLVAAGSIGWEAIQRFISPEETQGQAVSIIAGIGIVVNAASALFFLRDKDKELNARGAFLHMALDAIISLGVVIGGIIIYYTGIKWIDPLISLIIMATVIYSTWGLLAESLHLSLDAVPSAINVDSVKSEMMKVEGIVNIYHIHIWAIGTTKNAITAHLVLKNDLSEKQAAEIKNNVRHRLEHFNIQHATLETEIQGMSKTA